LLAVLLMIGIEAGAAMMVVPSYMAAVSALFAKLS
jgi:hypothetical protein